MNDNLEEYKDLGLNQSRLKEILKDPRKYYYYEEERSEDSPSYFKIGSYVDDLITDPTSVQDKYAVITATPSDNITWIIDDLFNNYAPTTDNLEDCKDTLQVICQSRAYGQSYKEETLLKKIKEGGGKAGDTKGEDYFKQLVDSRGKVIISQEDERLGNSIRDTIVTTDHLKRLFISSEEGVEIQLQKVVSGELYGRKCKGKLDSLIVDNNNKTMQVVDLKTTGSSILYFESSIFKYRYDFQLTFYNMLLERLAEEVGYKILNPQLVVFSTNGDSRGMVYELPAFKAKYSYEKNGRIYYGVEEAFEILEAHEELDNFEYPLEYLKNGFVRVE